MPDIFIAPKKESQKPGINHRQQKALASLTVLSPHLARLTKNPLASFATFPDGVKFETQEKDEPIILLLRPHWIMNVPWILAAVLLILGPAILPLTPLMDLLPLRFKIVLIVLWYLLVLSYLFERFISWFFNIFLVTDKRVVDVDFYSFTYKQVSEAALDKIVDISYKTGGLTGSVFNLGDVFIQTAGEKPNIEFEKVPHPDKVVKVIRGLIPEGKNL